MTLNETGKRRKRKRKRRDGNYKRITELKKKSGGKSKPKGQKIETPGG
jgi:hypothetical protein